MSYDTTAALPSDATEWKAFDRSISSWVVESTASVNCDCEGINNINNFSTELFMFSRLFHFKRILYMLIFPCYFAEPITCTNIIINSTDTSLSIPGTFNYVNMTYTGRPVYQSDTLPYYFYYQQINYWHTSPYMLC